MHKLNDISLHNCRPILLGTLIAEIKLSIIIHSIFCRGPSRINVYISNDVWWTRRWTIATAVMSFDMKRPARLTSEVADPSLVTWIKFLLALYQNKRWTVLAFLVSLVQVIRDPLSWAAAGPTGPAGLAREDHWRASGTTPLSFTYDESVYMQWFSAGR
jgi:hypothetical protein